MDRRSFLSSSAAVAEGMFLLPSIAAAREKPASQARFVRVAEVAAVWALGVRVTVRACSSTTGGGYAVIEELMWPGQSPPLHTLTKEDETLNVIEGELELVLGGQTYTARPGDLAHMARGVPRRFKNLTNKPARMLHSYSPGGFEQWFLDVGTAVTDPDERPPAVTPAQIREAIEVTKAYGLTFHMN